MKALFALVLVLLFITCSVQASEAQFFKDWMKKAGRWLKEPENLQKVVDIYRTVRSDDEDDEDDEESDLRFAPGTDPAVVAAMTKKWLEMINRNKVRVAQPESDLSFAPGTDPKVMREATQRWLERMRQWRTGGRRPLLAMNDEEESDEISQNASYNFGGSFNDAQFGEFLKKFLPQAKEAAKKFMEAKGAALSDESHSSAYSRISSAGIGISSSGGCSDRNNRRCTSLDGIRSHTIDMIITFKRASGCPVTITGGTEVGHAGGAISHANGYKVDIALNSCVDNYITRSFSYAGRRGDGAAMYKSSSGSIYAKEGSHWDIAYP